MILLDTNIILRFILDDDPILSSKTKTIFKKIEQEKNKVFISLLTLSEVIFTLERSYKLPKKEITDKMLAIGQIPNIVIENYKILPGIFTFYIEQNISFIDAYHIALMHKKKIKEIYSFDHDFDKFPQIKRLES